MSNKGNIKKLELARDRVAEVYRKETKTQIPDNGNLTTLNNAILSIQISIRNLKNREE